MLIDSARIKYPPWHEDARRMRQSGMKVVQIARVLNESGIDVSPARVSQVTNPQWEQTAERDRLRKRKDYNKKEEEPVSDRLFERVVDNDPTNVHHRVRIRCSHDGCSATMIFARRGSIHPTQAAQWFRDKGWAVGGGPRADLCPSHHKRLNNGHAMEPEDSPLFDDVKALPEPVVPEQKRYTEQEIKGTGPDASWPEHPGVYVPPSRQTILEYRQQPEVPPAAPDQMAAMTRTDRRLINAKLNDVYVDEERGYRDDWSDQKVAEDLGASVLWVAAIREENFGPDINEADVLRERELTVVMEAFKKVAAEALEAIKEYDQKVEQIDAKLDAFDKVHAEFMAILIRHERKKT